MPVPGAGMIAHAVALARLLSFWQDFGADPGARTESPQTARMAQHSNTAGICTGFLPAQPFDLDEERGLHQLVGHRGITGACHVAFCIPSLGAAARTAAVLPKHLQHRASAWKRFAVAGGQRPSHGGRPYERVPGDGWSSRLAARVSGPAAR